MEKGKEEGKKGNEVRSIPKGGPNLPPPLHFDIFRSAKLRLATQKMIYAPGGRTQGPPSGSEGRGPSTIHHIPMMM